LILLLTTAPDAVVGNAHPTKKIYQLVGFRYLNPTYDGLNFGSIAIRDKKGKDDIREILLI